MGRKPQKLNEKTGERLKELLRENNCSQAELAEKLNYSVQHISYIINGKRTLAVDTAMMISQLFGNVRYEWLLGIDDYKTKCEQFKQYIGEQQTRLGAFRLMAHFAGYDIELFPGTEGKISAPTAIQMVKEGYKIIKDDKVIGYCSLDRLNLLVLDAEELIAQRINSCLREVENENS